MSWDARALIGLALIWVVLSGVYVTVIHMMPGARGWGAGAALFLLLAAGVWYAERRGARAMRRAPRREEAGRGAVAAGVAVATGSDPGESR